MWRISRTARGPRLPQSDAARRRAVLALNAGSLTMTDGGRERHRRVRPVNHQVLWMWFISLGLDDRHSFTSHGGYHPKRPRFRDAREDVSSRPCDVNAGPMTSSLTVLVTSPWEDLSVLPAQHQIDLYSAT